jgi:indolepyruvate ferredoxin oxidoreductase
MTPATLDDRYLIEEGRIYLTGMQAITRAIIDQSRRDKRAGAVRGTFISGYPGSPLGGLENVLRSAGNILEQGGTILQPAVNEELAATAVLGATKRGIFPDDRIDGVTGIWYGKCNGVDRCVDVFKYGNYGGMGADDAVLVLAGDDPNVKSSGIPGESEHTLAAAGIPVLYPSSVEEFHTFTLHGIAMSRSSGCWVGLKLTTDLCDGGAIFDVSANRPDTLQPDPPSGFSKFDTYFYFGQPILDGEDSLYGPRHEIVRNYARLNELDRVVVDGPNDRLAILAAGKTYSDTRQALTDLGLDDGDLRSIGVRLMKLGLIYPLDGEGLATHLAGVEKVLVIEEKRGIVEQQLKAQLFGTDDAPDVIGKQDEQEEALIPIRGELDADLLQPILARRLRLLGWSPESRRTRIPIADSGSHARRSANYCSGCPHSRGTVTPDGQTVLGGIGCHSIGMFLDQPSRRYEYNVQMGGEGAPWIGTAPYVGTDHIIQNLGDGTYFHSASQSVRACIEAGVNVTFRLLYNGYISMTGGQGIPGAAGATALAKELAAMGVARTVIVTETPRDLRRVKAKTIEVVGPDDLTDSLERLTAIPGVTVLIHDRACALERRRSWRRGATAPSERLMIHERLCEGCGDCGAKANCPSLEPVQTEFGRKTRIQQSSCAVDLACLEGDCPSFITVTTSRGSLVGRKRPPEIDSTEIPAPHKESAPRTDLLIIGIGGTGIVTVNALLAHAALHDGIYAVTLDQTGLAQKGGPVGSHIRFATSPDLLATNKVGERAADTVLALDLIEAVQPHNLARFNPERTGLVADLSVTPTGEMIRDPWVEEPDADAMFETVSRAAHPNRQVALPARDIAERLFGDHMKANLISLGAALQSGLLPVSVEAVEAAIRLNGVEVEENILALSYGRLWLSDPGRVRLLIEPTSIDPVSALSPKQRLAYDSLTNRIGSVPGDLRGLLLRRTADLIDYQSPAYASSYLDFMEEFIDLEQRRFPESARISESVAKHLYKLMAYKDEYETARLLLDPAWRSSLGVAFGENPKVRYNLHPPILRAIGIDRKLRFGSWFDPVLRVLRAMRRLRGSRLDPFGRLESRRLEKELPNWYRDLLRSSMLTLDMESMVELADLPDQIRGYEDVKKANAERVREQAADLIAMAVG